MKSKHRTRNAPLPSTTDISQDTCPYYTQHNPGTPDSTFSLPNCQLFHDSGIAFCIGCTRQCCAGRSFQKTSTLYQFYVMATSGRVLCPESRLPTELFSPEWPWLSVEQRVSMNWLRLAYLLMAGLLILTMLECRTHSGQWVE